VFDWTVPGYRGIRELGQGPSGRTVAGAHDFSGLPVTIRYHAQAWLDDYRDAARVLAGLQSPHVARLFEYVESDHGAATVREYVDGVSARQLVSGGALRPELALALLRAGLAGLTAAHDRAVTHRGYRLENVLVDLHGAVRVTDFAVSPPSHSTTTTPDAVSDTGVPPPDADALPDDGERGETVRDVMDRAEAVRHDVRAAFSTFLTCMTGRAVEPGAVEQAAGRLPRKLRPLADPAAAGDGAALLAAVEQAGRTLHRNWTARATEELAARAAKAKPKRGR
jgi:serine/threonine-protein kinase